MKTHHIDASFSHLIYSPRGAIEGMLLLAEEGPIQVVMDSKESDGSAVATLTAGVEVKLAVTKGKPSHKGEGKHPVYRFDKLLAIDGAKPAKDKSANGREITGKVAHLNYAKHGAANGVVLDTGDFVHLKPEGMAAAKLGIGDKVVARGEMRSMALGSHFVMEANHVNGKAVRRKH